MCRVFFIELRRILRRLRRGASLLDGSVQFDVSDFLYDTVLARIILSAWFLIGRRERELYAPLVTSKVTQIKRRYNYTNKYTRILTDSK